MYPIAAANLKSLHYNAIATVFNQIPPTVLRHARIYDKSNTKIILKFFQFEDNCSSWARRLANGRKLGYTYNPPFDMYYGTHRELMWDSQANTGGLTLT